MRMKLKTKLINKRMLYTVCFMMLTVLELIRGSSFTEMELPTGCAILILDSHKVNNTQNYAQAQVGDGLHHRAAACNNNTVRQGIECLAYIQSHIILLKKVECHDLCRGALFG